VTDFQPPPPFALTEDDRHSPLWMRLKAHFEDSLADARRSNDRPFSERETATLRGEIMCLKKLIRLDADRPEMTGSEYDQPP
jgi:hypothetical protein